MFMSRSQDDGQYVMLWVELKEEYYGSRDGWW